MTIQDWTTVGALVCGLAVILSLIYMATQVRNNTRAAKLQSYQTLLDNLASFDLVLATEPDLHRIKHVAEKSRGHLSQEDWSRYVHFTLPRLSMWEFAFEANRDGDLDRYHWQAFDRQFVSLFAAPNSALRAVYEEHRDRFVESFQRHIETIQVP